MNIMTDFDSIWRTQDEIRTVAHTAIFTLTSELHDEQAVDAVTKVFLGSLGFDHLFKGSDNCLIHLPASPKK